jgi:ABC-type lipoprotein export system ATPase subunit
LGSGDARVTPLRDLSLSVAAGKTVAVRGPSGSGKSTLLRVLAGDLEPEAGWVTVAGLAPREARRSPGIGLVYQDFQLVSFLTGLENVAMALEVRGEPTRSAVRRGREMLEALGVAHLADRFPRQMSGGEQQRVAIARTMVCQPALVLADEPTAALDRATAEAVIKVLCGAAFESGATLVVATHDPMVAAATDVIYDRRATFRTHCVDRRARCDGDHLRRLVPRRTRTERTQVLQRVVLPSPAAVLDRRRAGRRRHRRPH